MLLSPVRKNEHMVSCRMNLFSMSQQISISYGSLIRGIIVLLVVVFLYLIRDVLLILFLSIVLASALEPAVSWFERHHMPRGAGIAAIYIIVFAVLSFIGLSIAPAIGAQAKLLATNLPAYYHRIVETWNLPDVISETNGTSIENISTTLGSLTKSILPAIKGVFGGGVTLFLILVLTFYLSVEDKGLKNFFRSILPDVYQPYFTRTVNRIQQTIGLWFRGQLFLSLVIFMITGISLFIVHTFTGGVPFWLVLAVIAGILEVIPFLGPIIAGALAVLVVLSHSLWLTGVVVLLYVVVQQLENHILVPKIMQRTVGLNPIIIILVVIIGGRLGGVLGAFIAIPLTAVLHVFMQDVLKENKNQDNT